LIEFWWDFWAISLVFAWQLWIRQRRFSVTRRHRQSGFRVILGKVFIRKRNMEGHFVGIRYHVSSGNSFMASWVRVPKPFKIFLDYDKTKRDVFFHFRQNIANFGKKIQKKKKPNREKVPNRLFGIAINHNCANFRMNFLKFTI